MRDLDNRHRFLIESCNVRGQLVRLDQTWIDACARTEYPEPVANVLGEAFSATVLLASTIKFDGKLTLQVRGSGDIYLLVVQITADGKLRGLARWNQVPEKLTPAGMFGDDARMTITIEANKYSEPYQGIVPLQGDTLADAICHYFLSSEQLETKLFFAVSDGTAAGLLLQSLPAQGDDSDANDVDEDGWSRAIALADTLSDIELLNTDATELLHRLYHEERVRLFEPTPVQFNCSCSRERTDDMLIGLGITEVNSIVEEQGAVEINCEFCDAQYRYDAVDVVALFKGVTGEPDASTRH